jgi:hypothetical protein
MQPGTPISAVQAWDLAQKAAVGAGDNCGIGVRCESCEGKGEIRVGWPGVLRKGGYGTIAAL